MTDAPWLDNLWSYSLQVLAVVFVGTALPWLLRLRVPRFRLANWQALLVLCLLLPVLQPWRSVPAAASVDSAIPVAVVSDHAVTTEGAVSAWSVADWVLVVLACGSAARLLWLALGLVRLRRYRLRSLPLDPLPAAIKEMRESVGVRADVRVSSQVKGPVTFGLLRPVVLFPVRLLELSSEVQRGIACHELLHVRRRDWAFTVAEELIRALLWFHPAIWWLISRIQLTREQVVDREVLARTESREPYMEALLTMSGGGAQLDLAPAPLFLRKRHLNLRVASLLEEITMSNRKLVSCLALTVMALALTTWLSVGQFPLHAEPQQPAGGGAAGAPPRVIDITDGGGSPIAIEQGGDHLLHRPAIRYPRAAREKEIEGQVSLQVSVDENGNVYDAHVISGPDELRAEALRSVLQWHYSEQAQRSSKSIVTFRFELPEEGDERSKALRDAEQRSDKTWTLERIDVAGVSDVRRVELIVVLPIQVGDAISPYRVAEIRQAVQSVDEHLRLIIRFPRADAEGEAGARIRIFLPPDQISPGATPTAKRIRVGRAVQTARLSDKVAPVYPPLARQSGTEGTVNLHAVIAIDGSVQSLDVIGGPALLVPAAVDAVKQWRYNPTLLNGEPVEVATEVEVYFKLTF